ncbi:MAG: S8 family peptidase [Myxococcota bacterium]
MHEPSRPIQAPIRLIVGFDQPPSPSDIARLTALGAHVKHSFRLSAALLLELPEAALTAVTTALRQDPHLRYLEPDLEVSLRAVPNDPLWPGQWGLHHSKSAGGDWRIDVDAPDAWDVVTADASVVIALADTGVDASHPDLSGAIWTNAAEAAGVAGVDDDGNGYTDDLHGYNFHDGTPLIYRNAEEDWHGTHLAGILAATANDGVGIAGLAAGARVMVCKFIGGPKVTGTSAAAAEAIEYAAAHGVRLINASFGTPAPSTLLADTIAASGALVIAAAGNDRRDIDAKPSYPASLPLPTIITVAAVDRFGKLATGWGEAKNQGSNWGATAVDLAAPGDAIRSTWPEGRWGGTSGTSMATPLVTATAALLLSWDPTLTNPQLRAAILDSAVPWPSLQGKVATGGLLNARAALDYIGGISAFSPPATSVSAEDSVRWAVYQGAELHQFAPSVPPPGGATQPFLASLALRAHAVSGPLGGRVSAELLLPGQAPRVLWRQGVAPLEIGQPALHCDGPTLPTCALPPAAVPGYGPYTLRLSATGDAELRVTGVRYVWRAEVAP